MKYNLKRLERVAKNRRPTYMAELLACGEVVGDDLVFGDDPECYAYLMSRKHLSPMLRTTTRADLAPRPTPIPRASWPLVVRAVARAAHSDDTGIGDTAQRMIAKAGGEHYKNLLKRYGIDCGCSTRQRHLNLTYPYPPVMSKPYSDSNALAASLVCYYPDL